MCQESKMEKAARKYLENNKIAGLMPQFRLNDTMLKLDFYIQQINSHENMMHRIVEIVNKYALISEIPPKEDLS